MNGAQPRGGVRNVASSGSAMVMHRTIEIGEVDPQPNELRMIDVDDLVGHRTSVAGRLGLERLSEVLEHDMV